MLFGSVAIRRPRLEMDAKIDISDAAKLMVKSYVTRIDGRGSILMIMPVVMMETAKSYTDL